MYIVGVIILIISIIFRDDIMEKWHEHRWNCSKPTTSPQYNLSGIAGTTPYNEVEDLTIICAEGTTGTGNASPCIDDDGPYSLSGCNQMGVAGWDYAPTPPDALHLTLTKGDHVTIMENITGGWIKVRRGTEEGLVPETYIIIGNDAAGTGATGTGAAGTGAISCNKPTSSEEPGYVIPAGRAPTSTMADLHDLDTTGFACNTGYRREPVGGTIVATRCGTAGQPYTLSGCVVDDTLPECQGTFMGITRPQVPGSLQISEYMSGSCNGGISWNQVWGVLNTTTGTLNENRSECSQRYIKNITSLTRPDEYIQCQQRADNSACDKWLPNGAAEETTRSDTERKQCREPSQKFCQASTGSRDRPIYFFDTDVCSEPTLPACLALLPPTAGDEVCICRDGESKHYNFLTSDDNLGAAYFWCE